MPDQKKLVIFFSVVMFLTCWLGSRNSHAESALTPEVQGIVDRGIAYLEKNYQEKTQYGFKNVHDPGFGEHALMGYTHMKVHHDPNNPVVKQGVRSSLALVRRLGERVPVAKHEGRSVYSVSICAMLLAEVDSIKYRNELNQIADYFGKMQYSHGAYSYPLEPEGDTSQTQYAMLAQWTLDRAGVVINYPGVPQTVNWLLRVQDPNGGWPYLGVIAPNRVKQQRVTASMAVAGGSAILIAGDILNLWGDNQSGLDPRIADMPKAIKVFKEGMENASIARPVIPTEPILAAIKECDGWLRSNSVDPGKLDTLFPCYQLYTTERYYSFREIALGLPKDESPPWFRDGLNYLKSEQLPAGGWPAETATSDNSTTSFAILFLIRSTQKAIEKAAGGTLAGGWELPKDTTNITIEGTQIKGKPVAEAVGGLLDLLESDGADNLEGKSIPDDLKLATEPKERAAQIDRFERLVRGSKSWQARRVACRLVGQSDELRVVPTLIYALSDPDPMVPLYARDGLRFISRNFEGFGMPNKPNESDIWEAQKKWRQWYLKMNPGYVFLDYDL